MMNLEKWKPIFFPVTLWLSFKVIAFFLGFTDWPDLASSSLIGASSAAISPLAFGLWIGVMSHKNFKLGATLRNALVVGLLVGFTELLLTLILINSSPGFVSYVTSIIYNAGRQYGASPIINLVVSKWLGDMFLAMASSAAGYFLMEREKKGR